MQNLRTKTPARDWTTLKLLALSSVSSVAGRPFASLHAETQDIQPIHLVVSTRIDLLMRRLFYNTDEMCNMSHEGFGPIRQIIKHAPCQRAVYRYQIVALLSCAYSHIACPT